MSLLALLILSIILRLILLITGPLSFLVRIQLCLAVSESMSTIIATKTTTSLSLELLSDQTPWSWMEELDAS